MNAIAIAIIGMGPRGMTVLERLISMGRRFPSLSLTIHIVEPGAMGCGVHQLLQPDYLLLNTVCGLPTMFPPKLHATDIEGESFFAWVQRQAATNRTAGTDDISQSCYLPRAAFGAYLQACFESIMQQRPSNVDIVTHACEAVALWHDEDGECIECSDGTRVSSRFVVLTTGHTQNKAPGDGALYDTYGFLTSLDESSFGANDKIGVAGFGLNAFDAVAGLTIGRGGGFSRDSDDKLRYLKSGREPLIYMFSRSGLPYLARPYGDCGNFRYDPVVFDARRVRSIRCAEKGGGLDFLSTLRPLLNMELRAAHCRMKLKLAGRPVSDDDWSRLRASDLVDIERWVTETERAIGALDLGNLFEHPGLSLGSGMEYQRHFVDMLEADLRECSLGVERSVNKQLAEILLCLRDSFNEAVDFGGLDAGSHDYFFGSFAGTLRRLAIGPQPERCEELVALIRAGVVTVQVGPDPAVERQSDGAFKITGRNLVRPSSYIISKLIQAQSSFPSVEQSESPLLSYLALAGRIRKHRDDVRFEAGVQIDRSHHPIGRSGRAETSLFVLGPLCEGSIYYNTYVPTTVGCSRPFVEAQIVVDQIGQDLGLTMGRSECVAQNGGYGDLP